MKRWIHAAVTWDRDEFKKRVFEFGSIHHCRSGYAPEEMRKGTEGHYEREPQNSLQRELTACVEQVAEKYNEMFIKLSTGDICYNIPDYIIVRLFGGRNGADPDWETYWAELYQFLKEINDTKISEGRLDSWVIDLENDCADDVFDMMIGVGLR